MPLCRRQKKPSYRTEQNKCALDTQKKKSIIINTALPIRLEKEVLTLRNDSSLPYTRMYGILGIFFSSLSLASYHRRRY